MEINEITGKVIELAIDIHRELGPGLLESIYEEVLSFELSKNRIPFQSQVHLPISYKGFQLKQTYRADLIVAEKVIVEIKSIEQLAPVHHKQLLTYLKIADLRVGLLINFNESILKNGLKRIANKY